MMLCGLDHLNFFNFYEMNYFIKFKYKISSRKITIKMFKQLLTAVLIIAATNA